MKVQLAKVICTLSLGVSLLTALQFLPKGLHIESRLMSPYPNRHGHLGTPDLVIPLYALCRLLSKCAKCSRLNSAAQQS